MGHRESTNAPADPFSSLAQEGVAGGFPQAAHSAEAAKLATFVPGCIGDNAMSSWEYYWIDFGGEG